MKGISLLVALLALASTQASAQLAPDGSVTINDSHEYVGLDRETLVFRDESMIVELHYKNSYWRELSRISVRCRKNHKTFSFSDTYFAFPPGATVDTRRDENGRVNWAGFQMNLKTDRNATEPDHGLAITCSDDKVDLTIYEQQIVR